MKQPSLFFFSPGLFDRIKRLVKYLLKRKLSETMKHDIGLAMQENKRLMAVNPFEEIERLKKIIEHKNKVIAGHEAKETRRNNLKKILRTI